MAERKKTRRNENDDEDEDEGICKGFKSRCEF